CPCQPTLHHCTRLTLPLSPFFFSLLLPPPPRSTLFPYTTLFRSHTVARRRNAHASSCHTDRESRPRANDHRVCCHAATRLAVGVDRKSTRLNSSHVSISYAVFCLKKKKKKNRQI